MSEEIAVSDNARGEDANVPSDGATVETVAEAAGGPQEQQTEAPSQHLDELTAVPEDTSLLIPIKPEPDPEPEAKIIKDTNKIELKVKEEVDETEVPLEMDIKDEFEATDNIEYFDDDDDKRGIKRRASDAFDDEVELKGFEKPEDLPQLEYCLTLERLEAEVKAASKGFIPLRTVMATPSAPARASKRPRKDTDGSRPSSALSSRSEDDVNPSASPAQRGRRNTSEMSSPLYRIPIDMGWKRELVFRAALDAHSRRNADIYYYTPYGKKLRSMREIGEHLSGTGLTLDNFTFFKEPLGLDDPEKEIIRDAKLVGGHRRVESPIASPAPATVDGKRIPKPKAPKGASPEPSTPKSPPSKLKVKSVGSRLSGPPAATPGKKKVAAAAPASPVATPPPASTSASTATPDNNNTAPAAWKKPRDPAPTALPAPEEAPLPAPVAPAAPVAPVAAAAPVAPSKQMTPPPPPPLQSKPPPQMTSPDVQSPRQLVQPCSMSCGAGVPSLSCTACLCMYHLVCAGFKHAPPPATFLCKNCRKSSSPPLQPPPLTHKSGVTASSATLPVPAPVPTPRRLSVLQPNAHKPNDKRVLLRMKVSGGGADGERVWAVAQPRGTGAPRPPAPAVAPPAPSPPTPRLLAIRGGLPQSLALINGKRFIIVPRPAPLPNAQTTPAQATHTTAK